MLYLHVLDLGLLDSALIQVQFFMQNPNVHENVHLHLDTLNSLYTENHFGDGASSLYS